MRAECAKLKSISDNELGQACEMVGTIEEKFLAAESKLHAGEVLQADHKKTNAERRLQEVEACEDALQR